MLRKLSCYLCFFNERTDFSVFLKKVKISVNKHFHMWQKKNFTRKLILLLFKKLCVLEFWLFNHILVIWIAAFFIRHKFYCLIFTLCSRIFVHLSYLVKRHIFPPHLPLVYLPKILWHVNFPRKKTFFHVLGKKKKKKDACVKLYCYCSVGKSCLTLWLHGLPHTRLSCPWLSLSLPTRMSTAVPKWH